VTAALTIIKIRIILEIIKNKLELEIINGYSMTSGKVMCGKVKENKFIYLILFYSNSQ
jgi:hypothetical protein